MNTHECPPAQLVVYEVSFKCHYPVIILASIFFPLAILFSTQKTNCLIRKDSSSLTRHYASNHCTRSNQRNTCSTKDNNIQLWFNQKSKTNFPTIENNEWSIGFYWEVVGFPIGQSVLILIANNFPLFEQKVSKSSKQTELFWWVEKIVFGLGLCGEVRNPCVWWWWWWWDSPPEESLLAVTPNQMVDLFLLLLSHLSCCWCCCCVRLWSAFNCDQFRLFLLFFLQNKLDHATKGSQWYQRQPNKASDVDVACAHICYSHIFAPLSTRCPIVIGNNKMNSNQQRSIPRKIFVPLPSSQFIT